MSDAPAAPIRIKLADIDRTGRLRAVDPSKALLIAASMDAIGLQTPVQVRPAPKKAKLPFILVAGGTRCEAAAQLGWEEIDAVVVDLTPDQARMLEIDENLFRSELNELDRAVFLAEKKRLYEKLHPEAKHGGDRRSDQVAMFGNLIPRFTEEVCEHLGLSERSISRMLKRAELPLDVRERLVGTPIADNGSELDALLKLEPSRRHAALDLVLTEKAPRIAVAARTLAGTRDAAAQKSIADQQFEAFKRLWKATGADARGRIIAYLAETGALGREGEE